MLAVTLISMAHVVHSADLGRYPLGMCRLLSKVKPSARCFNWHETVFGEAATTATIHFEVVGLPSSLPEDALALPFNVFFEVGFDIFVQWRPLIFVQKFCDPILGAFC